MPRETLAQWRVQAPRLSGAPGGAGPLQEAVPPITIRPTKALPARGSVPEQ